MYPKPARLSLVPHQPDSPPEVVSSPGSVRLAGELDLATAPHVAEELASALEASRCVVVDLRALRFIDVAGMRVLLVASASARKDGRRLVIVRGPAPVDKVFTLTGSAALVETVDLAPGAPPERAARSAAPVGGVHRLRRAAHGLHDAAERQIEARLRTHLDVILP